MLSGPSCSGMAHAMAGTGGADTVRLLHPGRPEGPVLAQARVLVAMALSQAAGLLGSAVQAAPTRQVAALAVAPEEGDSPAGHAASAGHGPAVEVPDPVEVPAAVVSAVLAVAALAVPEAAASGAAELAENDPKSKTLSSFQAAGLLFAIICLVQRSESYNVGYNNRPRANSSGNWTAKRQGGGGIELGCFERAAHAAGPAEKKEFPSRLFSVEKNKLNDGEEKDRPG